MLKSAPLKDMLDHGQIDEFEVSAVSTDEDRVLGDVYVSVGIKPRRAIKHIYNDVYIK